MKYETVAVLIPAYKPSDRLVEITKELTKHFAGPIIIVDDGGGGAFHSVFEQLRAMKRVTVLVNAINLGKGAALKHGFNHALASYPDLIGIVTADADGQHAVEDVISVVREILAKPSHLVLGARTFGKGTPRRSLIGNNISRLLYRCVLGLKLRDTQTGLRGVSVELSKASLSIRSNRYEFETEQLSVASRLNLLVSEVPIRTIYEDENASSHFNPFFDSLRIYFVVFRYAIASIATSLVDFAVFIALAPYVPNTIAANLASRLVALFVQFALLRGFVFHSKAGMGKFLLFVGYVAITGLASGVLQTELTQVTGWPSLTSKIGIEVLIFMFNFLFLRDILFRKART